mmetsp:Transcript_10107/g.45763  ORF Transcript_10107/g.45763 Transcript_10107/m.45763 type:complete len:165 (-) Transcript_10107:160-654(-)
MSYATSCENLYTYSFTITVQGASASVTNGDHLHTLSVKLDGVLPSVDQFTVHVAPDRTTCNELPGGSCVAGVLGFIDGDELMQSNWSKRQTSAGTLLFSISTTVRVSEIEIAYHRPMYAPGWLIKENGVEVYRDSTNGGSDSWPNPAPYTFKLHTLPKAEAEAL